MAKYYDDAGKKLTGSKLKKYLDALKKAEQTGKPYTGTTYYTKEALEAKYNGFDIATIRQAGKLRSLLLEAPKEYTSLTDEELNAQATAGAETEANLARQQAEALYNSNKTTLENEAAGLASIYKPQVDNANRQTAQNVDSLQGSMLSRGLGRSSYAGALQQATQQAGANAVASINADMGQKQQAIGNQLSTLGTNYNTARSTIDENRTANIKNMFNSLKQQDYEKGLSTSDARTTFLWNLLNQKKKVSSGGGSSSRRSSSSSSSTTSTGNGNGGGNWLQDWLNSLLG